MNANARGFKKSASYMVLLTSRNVQEYAVPKTLDVSGIKTMALL
jgi:hypothetical protein